MAEIINLRTARKRKASAEKANRAADNRVKFGRPKSEKALGHAEVALQKKQLDGHRRVEVPESDQIT